MASVEVHMADCNSLLGQEFKDVHIWLDKYASQYPPPIYLEYHRKFRHNEKGLKEVWDKWGALAADAAKIHLIRDVEIYILQKPLVEVLYDEIDELAKKSFGFFPPEGTRRSVYSKW